jgi:hypothetical protein
MAHKGFGAPLPSLSSIKEMREEVLKPLLQEEEMELLVIKIGLRRARPLGLPAPPVLFLPAPGDAERALAAAQAALLSKALTTLPQTPAFTPADDEPDFAFLVAYMLILTVLVVSKRVRGCSSTFSLPAPADADEPLAPVIAPVPTVTALIEVRQRQSKGGSVIIGV